MMPASDALEAFPRGAVPACYVFGFKFGAPHEVEVNFSLHRHDPTAKKELIFRKQYDKIDDVEADIYDYI